MRAWRRSPAGSFDYKSSNYTTSDYPRSSAIWAQFVAGARRARILRLSPNEHTPVITRGGEAYSPFLFLRAGSAALFPTLFHRWDRTIRQNRERPRSRRTTARAGVSWVGPYDTQAAINAGAWRRRAHTLGQLPPFRKDQSSKCARNNETEAEVRCHNRGVAGMASLRVRWLRTSFPPPARGLSERTQQ